MSANAAGTLVATAIILGSMAALGLLLASSDGLFGMVVALFVALVFGLDMANG